MSGELNRQEEWKLRTAIEAEESRDRKLVLEDNPTDEQRRIIERLEENAVQAAPHNSKYTALLTERGLARIAKLRKKGATQAEVAEYFGLSVAVLSERKRLHPELWAAMHPGKPFAARSPLPSTDQDIAPEDRLESPVWLEKVEKWIMCGMTEDAVAALIGLLPEEFQEAKERQRAVKLAVARGHARGQRIAAEALWSHVQSPGTPGHGEAVRFYLRAKSWGLRPTEPKAPPAPSDPEPEEESALSADEILARLGASGGPPRVQIKESAGSNDEEEGDV